MITAYHESVVMPPYIVAEKPIRQVWVANAAAFAALGIFRDFCDFTLSLTQSLSYDGLEITQDLNWTLPLLEDS